MYGISIINSCKLQKYTFQIDDSKKSKIFTSEIPKIKKYKMLVKITVLWDLLYFGLQV